MEWITIVFLLIFSLGLIVIEIIFIPGTTLFGIAGFAFGVIGIYIGFHNLGSTTGFIVLSVFLAVAAATIFYSFKSQAWQRFALNTAITSKVNDEHKVLINVGDMGKAISALRPSGKVQFDDKIVEVRTTGSFLEEGCYVTVVGVNHNKVFVAPV
jgi:membrane-bound ClpP family serine protease